MLGTVYFLKIAKINSQREKPICNRKISSRKTQKTPIHKNTLPQKFRGDGISDVCKREFTKKKTMRDVKPAKSKCDIVPNQQMFVDELKFNSRYIQCSP